MLFLNKGGSSASRLYDVIRNPSVNFGRQFQFLEVRSRMQVPSELLFSTRSPTQIENAVMYDGRKGDAAALCKEAGTKSNDSQLGAERPAENLQVKADESAEMQRFPVNSLQNSCQPVHDGRKIRPAGKKSAKWLRKRDDEECPYNDIVVLQDAITSWRSDVSIQLTESRAFTTALEELKMSQEQFVAEIDAYNL